MTFYYTGLREGEMLALTPADVDLEKATIRVNKNYQNVDGEEMITTPKTPKSNRVVTIPAMLVECLREYMGKWYGLEQDDRIFPYTKNIVNHVMARACEEALMKKTPFSYIHYKRQHKNNIIPFSTLFKNRKKINCLKPFPQRGLLKKTQMCAIL